MLPFRDPVRGSRSSIRRLLPSSRNAYAGPGPTAAQDIHAPKENILPSMTKRLVDVDDNKLEEVRILLGTTTMKATVNGALEEVLALAARRRTLLDGDAAVGSSDLAQEEERRAAWA